MLSPLLTRPTVQVQTLSPPSMEHPCSGIGRDIITILTTLYLAVSSGPGAASGSGFDVASYLCSFLPLPSAANVLPPN